MNRRNILDLIFSSLLVVSLATHFWFYLEFQERTQKFMSVGKRLLLGTVKKFASD